MMFVFLYPYKAPNFVSLMSFRALGFIFISYLFIFFSIMTNNDSIFQIGSFGQCTDSDGCAVDRATAWCEMTDTVYYRSVNCNPGYTEAHQV